MKIKHSVSSPVPPTKYGGSFFAKNIYMAEKTFLSKFIGECFTWGPIIRSYKRGEASLWLRGFKGQVKLVFLSLTLTWVIDILFEKLTPQIEH